jgi:hypothetical protein
MTIQFLLVLIALPSIVAFTWTLSNTKQRHVSSRLEMAGGRSPSELKLSKRGMFLQLKQKLKTAAEVPGFFQSSKGEPVAYLSFLLNNFVNNMFFYFVRILNYIVKVIEMELKLVIALSLNSFKYVITYLLIEMIYFIFIL